jgi:hypothetical protein
MRQHAGTRVTSILDGANATPGEGSRIPDGGTKLPAELAIASEVALTLIGASLNKLVFPAILRSRRRPMQEASAYGAKRKPSADIPASGFCPIVLKNSKIGPHEKTRQIEIRGYIATQHHLSPAADLARLLNGELAGPLANF